MASFNLTSNTTWSAFIAANPTMTNGDQIVATGAYTLTLDVNPSLTDITFNPISNSVSALLALGAVSTYTLQNWTLTPYNVTCLTIGNGKTVTGPIMIWGAISSTSKPGCVVSSGGTLTTATGRGGLGSGNHGISVSSGGTLTTGTGQGSTYTNSVYGINAASGSTCGTITGTGGTAGSGAYGANISGSVTTVIGYGAVSTNPAFGVNLNATNAVTSVTGTGGGIAGATGVSIANSNTVTSVTGTGSSTVAAIGVAITNYCTVTNCTGNGGGYNGANGVNISSGAIIANATANGGGTSGAQAIQNSGIITGGTATGGTVAGAHGILNYGTVYNVSASGTTAAAYGIQNAGGCILDVRNMSGYALQRYAGYVALFGGTSQTAITGTSGIIRFIPIKTDVRGGKTVLDETGTMPQIAWAA